VVPAGVGGACVGVGLGVPWRNYCVQFTKDGYSRFMLPAGHYCPHAGKSEAAFHVEPQLGQLCGYDLGSTRFFETEFGVAENVLRQRYDLVAGGGNDAADFSF
jgi:hypothetical protein